MLLRVGSAIPNTDTHYLSFSSQREKLPKTDSMREYTEVRKQRSEDVGRTPSSVREFQKDELSPSRKTRSEED